ncbi:hypothetical protein EC9_30950 [Rosistilla ulvae]|uniref:Sulfotransferase family protein n=1 Tax=Rosistilla ulvae TaxID=1930277 RepID=A0A517M211_9BACT|nr:sulfotransferase family 2 domain-containing protein [Rosistilla ulvae]QDS88900.1 hypothetical protein EC9_30950 [Rosistilla ulvae]
MAVFYNSSHRVYAFVSFKVLYSAFTAASAWDELDVVPRPRMLMREILNGGLPPAYHLVRSPVSRTVSCFMDKYRKQPTRIDCEGFCWQHCHEILYSHLGITRGASDSEIADAFLRFRFDEFVNLLPDLYHRDAHFNPQVWTNRLFFAGKHRMRWPQCKILRVEESESLVVIPDIDFSTKTNTTGHIERDFEVTDAQRSVIHQLYRADLALDGCVS